MDQYIAEFGTVSGPDNYGTDWGAGRYEENYETTCQLYGRVGMVGKLRWIARDEVMSQEVAERTDCKLVSKVP